MCGSGMIRGYADMEVDDKLDLVDKVDKVFENDFINVTFEFDVTEVEKKIKLCEELNPTNDKEFLINGYTSVSGFLY